MNTKDDPLESGRPPITLWLDREHMEESRDAFFRAWLTTMGAADSRPRLYFSAVEQGDVTVGVVTKSIDEAHVTWNIAYAAAVAAFEFLMSGKLRP